MRVARIVIDQAPGASRSAGFHLQQATEKYLNAFLTLSASQPPFIHDLEELRALVGEIAPDLADDIGALSGLNPFAVAGRYPTSVLAPGAQQAAALLHTAERVRAAVMARIDAAFEPADAHDPSEPDDECGRPEPDV